MPTFHRCAVCGFIPKDTKDMKIHRGMACLRMAVEEFFRTNPTTSNRTITTPTSAIIATCRTMPPLTSEMEPLSLYSTIKSTINSNGAAASNDNQASQQYQNEQDGCSANGSSPVNFSDGGEGTWI
jgi:hypothetical protein